MKKIVKQKKRLAAAKPATRDAASLPPIAANLA
jgi:hypothetical protein